MKFRIAVFAVLSLVLAGLGWWFYSHLEYVADERDLAPRGQAAYDPLYAASLALKAYGAHAVVQPFFDLHKMGLSSRDTVIFYSDVRTLSPAEVTSLTAWIQSGGHLVVQLPDGADDTPPLLAAFGLQSGVRRPALCPKLVFNADTAAQDAEFCGYGAVRGERDDFTYSAGDRGDLLYVQRDAGSGWLAVVSSMDFMDNLHLKQPGDSGLMLRVVQPFADSGRIFLIYSLDVAGLPALIFRYGWMVVISLALVVAAFLFSVAPRFGPLQPGSAPPRRALLEHVRAGAEVLWRQRGERRLYQAVRNDMLLTLRRRHPAAGNAENKELLGSLAGITGLPRLAVRRALAMDSQDLRTGFVERIATLLEIRKRL